MNHQVSKMMSFKTKLSKFCNVCSYSSSSDSDKELQMYLKMQNRISLTVLETPLVKVIIKMVTIRCKLSF